MGDKLGDYIICLENAIRIIHKKSEGDLLEQLDGVLMNKEVAVLKKVKKDLEQINDEAYWGYIGRRSMIFKKEIDNLIKELEKDISTCREEDQFGYAKQDAYDVYKKVIKRLKEITSRRKNE